ncbi:ABC transporter ATP-binding protein [Ornithinicoccus hortensis]|uniref:ABC-type multidrug transport system fused ATPase/permease subunit n=1 Tax=Ornithinicoccus hortensis TaxID=82346 RepID=A0A542YU49_9MICO|nr:ABC transporter ATP-binding protein [Ornithinicoccus hortensis]TQL51612.1 ABC-type multidrug transport system fused ATPase/permease subunit [Ornithinicoccus hortensis]
MSTSTDLNRSVLADSPNTWRERSDRPPAIPDTLRPPVGASLTERQRALWQRHGIRRERAQAHMAQAFDPERGLPVARSRTVLAFLGGLLRRRGLLVVLVVLANALTAVAGLAVPMLLGRLVDEAAADGIDLAEATTGLVLLVTVVLVTQAVMMFLARWSGALLGQGVLAEAREYVIRAVLRLPLGRVENASTGDLVTRVTRDVGAMSRSVRFAIPEFIIGTITVLLTLVAMAVNSWFLTLPVLVLLSLAVIQVRRYLREAPAGYLTEGATYSQINTTLTETVEGVRTVEALGLQPVRRAAAGDDIEVSAQAERYGLTLRNLLFGVMDTAFSLPRVVTLVLGAWGYGQGWLTLGQITAAMLYVEQFYAPFDRLVGTIDELQVGVASTTRLLGIAEVPAGRTPGTALPSGRDLRGQDLRYAYREDHDVLHGIDLELQPGERLAIVGPSGSGKSTLGRLLGGIHAPRTGSVQVGGVELTELPLQALRAEVALVTQEHHVFRGSVRDNVVLARDGAPDEEVVRALRTVDAWDWVSALPEGLDTELGSGNLVLTPAQAQQVALARLILADPHTLVLDEATSLIDPRTARHLEGSMSALLTGRTVVAIAHRLHTAHDADRIAVVIDGRIAELGSHDELLAADGEYASLWRAWTS